MIRVRYFARYRETMAVADEQYPDTATTLVELAEQMRNRHPVAGVVLDDARCIVAVNQKVIKGGDVPLQSGDEVAFYPPVTGG